MGLNLDAGRRLLQGEIPYLDFVDTNPPLTSYLSIIPMVFHAAGLTIQQSFGLFVALLSIYSLTMLLLLFPAPGYDGRFVRIAFWVLLLFFALSNRAYDFGQREQLFILLFLPYPLLRWKLFNDDIPSGKLSWIVGIMAGIGCSIKPFFLLFPLLMELYWLLEYRGYASFSVPKYSGWRVSRSGTGFISSCCQNRLVMHSSAVGCRSSVIITRSIMNRCKTACSTRKSGSVWHRS